MNETLFLFLYSLALEYPTLSVFAVAGSDLLPYAIILLFVAFVFFKREHYKKSFLLLGTGLGAGFFARYVLVGITRLFVDSPRPFAVLESVNPLVVHEATASFPSGHAAFFGALAMVVFLVNKKAGAIFFLLALFVGTARVIAGIHWPLDIVAGIIAGTLIGWLAYLIMQKISEKMGL